MNVLASTRGSTTLPDAAPGGFRRVILVVCDGLGAEWVKPSLTPTLAELQSRYRSATRHRAIFPSVTRVSAATIATGCYPGRHGLHGNQVALMQGERLGVHNVGAPEFREQLRLATGATLKVPTLAARLAVLGGQVAYSNVSPGAAYFLDPDQHGTVLNRAGSFGPGGQPLAGAAHLNVSHDLAGDLAMTERFCVEVIEQGRSPLGILWLANPDLTLHHNALGSPDHLEALECVDSLVKSVAVAISDSKDRAHTLLIVASDHGHETIMNSIHIGDWLTAQGLGDALGDGSVAVASQGTAALLYALHDGRRRLERLLPELQRQPWVASIHVGEQLRALGLEPNETLFAAVDAGRMAYVNPYGIQRSRWMVEDGEAEPEIGCGQHGGLGEQETAPFLTLASPGLISSKISRVSSLVDIAPTILDYLSIPATGMDGLSLL